MFYILIPVILILGIGMGVYTLKKANNDMTIGTEKAEKVLKKAKTKVSSNKTVDRFKQFTYDSVVEENQSIKDYDTYAMKKIEYMFYVLQAAIGIGIVSYIFYRSFWVTGITVFLGFLYPKYKRKHLIYKQKQELALQFKEALYIISASLTAGQSVEMAFRYSVKDLKVLYLDPETPIIKEIELINHKMDLNGTIEEGLVSFARRAHLEEVTNFVDVFIACKRRGGNLVEIIRNTSRNIAEKIQIKQEIETLITEKKFEQKVLFGMPVFLIYMLDSSSPEFMAPVFTQVVGRIGMTVSVALFITAYVISSKIIRIEV